MSSTSKVVFKLETLKAQALIAIEDRISAAEIKVSETSDRSKIRQAQLLWRERQEVLLREILDVFEDMADEDLVDFKLEPYPQFDEFMARRVKTELAVIQRERASIIAKAESLVPDSDGNISLTKNQLKDFFGLG